MDFKKIRSTATYSYSDEQWGEVETLILKGHSGGWFDGEGYVGCQILTNGGIGVQSRIGNTYLRGLESFREMFGGVVKKDQKREGHKQTWRWVATGDTLRSFLEEIVPYLKDKESQAVYAQGILNHINQRQRKKLTDLDKEIYHKYNNELKAMKHDESRLSRSTLDRLDEPELTFRTEGNELEITLGHQSC